MSAKNDKKSGKNSTLIVAGIIALGAGLLFAYLMFYVSPDLVTERVKVVANTADGCIAESSDGFSVNIGPCDAKAGDFIVGTYDAKIKERRALMNPTS